MEFINLCPHNIVLNNGTVYPTSGIIARIGNTESERDSIAIYKSSQYYNYVRALEEFKTTEMMMEKN